MSDIHELVRARYAAAARVVSERASARATGPAEGCDAPRGGKACCSDNTAADDADRSCCGPSGGCCSDGEGSLYGGDAAGLPEAALQASLGCGNPVAVAELQPGETVLDLGSGGGIDVLLSARRVGPSGKVYGLDMTGEMLDLARRNQRTAGADNVRFLKGYIEDVPLPDRSVDVIISNCVINLAADKRRVFEEMHRVLRPGGRIGITDIVADDELGPRERAARGSYTGCIAGALSSSEYTRGLAAAGFEDVSITRTHEVADRMYSAVVRARRP